MPRLEDALRLLAERAEPIPSEVLIARIETELGWAPSAVAEHEAPAVVTSRRPDVEIPAAPPARRPRRGPLLAAAVAAVVMLAGGGVFWALGAFDTESEPADSVPLEIANVTAMYDALNAHDAGTYATYWAEGAQGWGPYMWGRVQAAIGSPEMDKGFEERRAWGAEFTLSDCMLVGETLRCLETWDDRVYHGMAGVTIDREAIYTFDDQGRIATMIHVNPYWDELTDFGQAFGPWLNTAHPEISATYLVPGFDDSFIDENWFATPENIAEITGLIEEFVAQSDVYPLAP